MPPMSRSRGSDCGVGAADRLVAGGEDLRRCAELAGQAVAEHVELERPDGGEDRRRLAVVEVAEHLHDALLVELLETLAELLGPTGVERAGGGEHLGGEAWDRRERHAGRPRRGPCRRSAGRWR